MQTQNSGRRGEEIAAQYLLNKGYQPIDSNYHSSFGEIDLIFQDGEYIVFVEVKLRKNDGFGAAVEAVSYRKREKIKKTALLWLSSEKSALQPRFDIVEIYAPDGVFEPVTLEHWINAFQ